MSEFWKSNAKKYCDYCKVWIADNKASISIHEQGNTHKKNVKQKLDEIKKSALQKRAEEKIYKETMASIEKAALKAMDKDLDDNPSLKKQYSISASAQHSSSSKTESKQSVTSKPLKVSAPDKKPKQKEDAQAQKRKAETLPEAKMGKWQTVEQTSKTPESSGTIDLQLPTASSSVKSFKSTFEQLQSERETDNEEKIVKKEPLSKWAPIAEIKETDGNEKNQVVSTEIRAIKAEIRDDLTKSDEQNSQAIQFMIKQEKQEVSNENCRKPNASNHNQEVPDKSETKSSKKEKVIVFKKRKVESISLRERADE